MHLPSPLRVCTSSPAQTSSTRRRQTHSPNSCANRPSQDSLTTYSAPHCTLRTPVRLVIAFAELAAGLRTLLGLFGRTAVFRGLALTFFLVVSFHHRPYYYGPDIVFLFAWTPLAISGSGRWSLDDYYNRKRGELGTAKLSKAKAAELDRRVVLQRGSDGVSHALWAGGWRNSGSLGKDVQYGTFFNKVFHVRWQLTEPNAQQWRSTGWSLELIKKQHWFVKDRAAQRSCKLYRPKRRIARSRRAPVIRKLLGLHGRSVPTKAPGTVRSAGSSLCLPMSRI